MSPIAPKVALLAMASTALAVPFGAGERHGHGHNHQHLHHTGHHGTGTGFPYPIANATGYWPTGTGAPTGYPTGFPTGFSKSAEASPVVLESDVVAVAAASAASSSTTCTDSVVYTTLTNRKTVYVTTSSASSSAASSTESSASLTLSVAQKGFGANKWHSKKASSTSTTAAAEATPSSSSSVYVAPTSSSSSTSTSVYVAATSTSASATSAAASSTSSSTSSSGKRGVAYNDASLCNAFEDATEVTWGYNWGQSSDSLSSSFNYVPLLWGTASSFTDDWSASAQAAIDAGSTHLMSFNEPDLSSQSDLSPAAAAAAYATYMEPFAGKAKLGAPAVTNGAGATGLDWLAAFLIECSDCTIDFIPIHWYSGSDEAAYFKEQVANATSVGGNKPVWVTEFGCTDGSDADISSFLEEVMPWMDEQSYVERYSYFMVAEGYLLSSGTELSTYGSTYMTYTS